MTPGASRSNWESTTRPPRSPSIRRGPLSPALSAVTPRTRSMAWRATRRAAPTRAE
jgi:hypothetical protein